MGNEEEIWVVMKMVRVFSNIVVIKYWGKCDEKFILFINFSISVMLDFEYLFVIIIVVVSFVFERDCFWFNGKVSFFLMFCVFFRGIEMLNCLIRWLWG